MHSNQHAGLSPRPFFQGHMAFLSLFPSLTIFCPVSLVFGFGAHTLILLEILSLIASLQTFPSDRVPRLVVGMSYWKKVLNPL